MTTKQVGFVSAFHVMIIGFVASRPASASEAILAPAASTQVATPLDSGSVANAGDAPAVVYSGTIEVSGSAWLRLNFAEVTLSGSVQAGTGSYLRLTSILDGGVQTLNETHAEQWQFTSAYFNGDAVLVELIAFPGTGENRLVINETTAAASFPSPRSLCGPDDDRVLSNDPRTGRVWPVGCTGWIIDDPNHCFLSAGHCNGSNFDIVEFNVPLSSSGGTPNHPPPEDQYAIDPASVQSVNGGIGNDWAYFGCFANPITGLTPVAAQGDFFVLSAAPPVVAGQTIRITGYGVTGSPVPEEWNAAQKTHTGLFVDWFDDVLQYAVDTTGGNSGSAVFNEDTGEAIGIHTHAGCNSSGGNHGTAIDESGLQNALANPQGVCVPTMGGCCVSFGCIVTTESTCQLNSGEFQGVATDCDPDPCPTCTLPGDLDQSGGVNGSDIAGYIRAKLGSPPEAGGNQACAEYGTGTLAGDTAQFVADLLN